MIAVLLALMMRLAIDPWLGYQSPYITFVLAVAVTGLYAGVRSALLASGLGAVVAYFCFVPPRYRWGFAGISDAAGFVVYLLVALAVVLLARARNQASATSERLLQEQLQTKGELLDAEVLFQSFMDHSPARMYLRDEEGRPVSTNEATRQVFGIHDDRGPKDGVRLPPQESTPQSREQDQEVLHAGHALQFVDRTSHPDGERYWLTCKFPFTDRARRRFVGGISLDITDRMQAEEILHRTEQLASAGQMASMLAHEINNPLAALTNLLYLLDQQPLPPGFQKYVSQANGELERINHIVAMTLGFYFERDTPASVRICQVIDEVIAMLGSVETFGPNHIDREFHCDPSVVASPPRIRQLLTSLLVNALESGAHGIRIRVANGRDWHRNGQKGVRITIADDGHGICSEHHHRLFQPFFSTKSEKGAGLGLWTSKAIVARINGTIRLRSAVAGARAGTCVRVFLPTTSEPQIFDVDVRQVATNGR